MVELREKILIHLPVGCRGGVLRYTSPARLVAFKARLVVFCRALKLHARWRLTRGRSAIEGTKNGVYTTLNFFNFFSSIALLVEPFTVEEKIAALHKVVVSNTTQRTEFVFISFHLN